MVVAKHPATESEGPPFRGEPGVRGLAAKPPAMVNKMRRGQGRDEDLRMGRRLVGGDRRVLGLWWRRLGGRVFGAMGAVFQIAGD